MTILDLFPQAKDISPDPEYLKKLSLKLGGQVAFGPASSRLRLVRVHDYTWSAAADAAMREGRPLALDCRTHDEVLAQAFEAARGGEISVAIAVANAEALPKLAVESTRLIDADMYLLQLEGAPTAEFGDFVREFARMRTVVLVTGEIGL